MRAVHNLFAKKIFVGGNIMRKLLEEYGIAFFYASLYGILITAALVVLDYVSTH